MGEETNEIYRALRESQNRYTYFLLAATGAAIALAVNQTRDAALAWHQTPLAFAVLCWALSFLFGCRHIAYVNSTLHANAEYLRVVSGQHPEFAGVHPQLVAAARDGIRSAMEHNADCANCNSHRQFRFLVTGAVFYVIWHVLEIYLRGARPV